MRSLTSVAEAVNRELSAGSEHPWYPIYNFLDAFKGAGVNERRKALRDEPPGINARFDAYLGAMAEHLALHHDLETPAWTLKDSRFLDESWVVPDEKQHCAIAFLESPAAFRRRGIFIMGDDLVVV